MAHDDDDFFDSDNSGEGADDDLEMDLSEVDESKADFPAVPPGVYNATVADADYGPSQRSGKKMVTWKFEIADGKFAGAKMNYYCVIESESGRARLKKLLIRIAPTCDLKKFKPATTPQELIGTPCRLKTKSRMFEGERRGDIKDVLAPAASKTFDE